jgi:hypothetical protein
MTDKRALELFYAKISREEGGRRQMHIGDLREAGRIMNKHLGGLLYAAIKSRELILQREKEEPAQ